MIQKNEFQALCTTFPALKSLDEKVAEIARDELDPGEAVHAVEAIHVGKVAGCAVLTARRVLVLWKMKMFIFFKFPTIQEFNLQQLRKVEVNGSSLSLRAEADPSDEDAGWEENTLQFASAEACQAFAGRLQ